MRVDVRLLYVWLGMNPDFVAEYVFFLLLGDVPFQRIDPLKPFYNTIAHLKFRSCNPLLSGCVPFGGSTHKTLCMFIADLSTGCWFCGEGNIGLRELTLKTFNFLSAYFIYRGCIPIYTGENSLLGYQPWIPFVDHVGFMA